MGAYSVDANTRDILAGNLNGGARFQVGDGPSADAFGRFRISEAVSIFENKNIHSGNSNQWTEKTSGGGSSITHDHDTASVVLTAGTGATDYALRQSVRYIPYVPGKSQLVLQTFTAPAAKTNVSWEIGVGDDNNGIFLEGVDSTIYAMIRSSTTGSAVETRVPQSEWNLDTLDGTGPSKLTLDISKSQILITDFQWLGVGRVRLGLDLNGVVVYFHEFVHANNVTEVYMSSPTLPVRYKIYNTDTTASATSLDEICCTVASEGGFTPPGIEFSQGGDITSRVAVTTRRPVFAIRLNSAFSGSVSDNRKTIRLLDGGFSTASNNAVFEIVHVHDPSSITATWTDIGGGSAAEYSTDISAVTGNPSHIVDTKFVPAATGGKASAVTLNTNVINAHSFLSQNFDSTNSQMFVVYATAETGTADVWTHLTWIEFE